MSGLKLEMTSYSDNTYDVTNFCCFEKFLAYTLFLPRFIVVKYQIAELSWGRGVVPTVHYWSILNPVQKRLSEIKKKCQY